MAITVDEIRALAREPVTALEEQGEGDCVCHEDAQMDANGDAVLPYCSPNSSFGR